MDSEAFDRLARNLGKPGTRRTALTALLGVVALGAAPAGAKKPRRRRDRSPVKAQAAAKLRSCPNPGPGKNLSKCDFTRADLRGRSLRGANLSQARLVGAELCGVDLRGANLHKTDFTGAHLTRADLRGTNLSTAILTDAHFCQTKRPNGTLDHTHCPPAGEDVCCGDDDCDGVCQRGLCLAASCHSLGQLCEPFGSKKCGGCCDSASIGPTCDPDFVVCEEEADIVTFRCQKKCETNADCARYGNNFECRDDAVHCHVGGSKCCLEKDCTRDENCPSGKCCHYSTSNGVCCRSDQRCGFPLFELPCVDQ